MDDRRLQSERLAPAALEVIALDAMALRSKLSETERARAILVMKSAVETLLASADSSAIQVPMQMLTTGLVAEAEAATSADTSRGGPPRCRDPDARDARGLARRDRTQPLRPCRAHRCGDPCRQDRRRPDILEQGVDKHPGEVENMAGEFLELWVNRLRPDAGSSTTRRFVPRSSPTAVGSGSRPHR